MTPLGVDSKAGGERRTGDSRSSLKGRDTSQNPGRGHPNKTHLP